MCRAEADTWVAIRVARDTKVGKSFKCFRKSLPKLTRGLEAIDQERCTPISLSMRKQMKHLEPDGICEICCICVSPQSKISICCIL